MSVIILTNGVSYNFSFYTNILVINFVAGKEIDEKKITQNHIMIPIVLLVFGFDLSNMKVPSYDGILKVKFSEIEG